MLFSWNFIHKFSRLTQIFYLFPLCSKLGLNSVIFTNTFRKKREWERKEQLFLQSNLEDEEKIHFSVLSSSVSVLFAHTMQIFLLAKKKPTFHCTAVLPMLRLLFFLSRRLINKLDLSNRTPWIFWIFLLRFRVKNPDGEESRFYRQRKLLKCSYGYGLIILSDNDYHR